MPPSPGQQLRCPDGHASQSDDYCDVCGMPMSSGGAAPAPASRPEPAAAKPPAGLECPNCSVMNAAEALFCEACGYDFTTGTMPRPTPNPLDLDTPMPAADSVGERDNSESKEAEPAPAKETAPAAAPQPVPFAQPVGPPAQAQQPAPAQPPQTDERAEPIRSTPARPDRSDSDAGWVLEVWIDPEWYALQQSSDPMPSPGLPHVVPLRKRSVLIGRPSRSRGITPDIDCEPDSGISRRQAQLSTDGTRWFVEDLDSANGTYVADAAGPLPTTPIPSGRRHELDGDDRIYLGAWTRLVLRRSTPEELELYAEG
ncbi:phosphopeptide-binding protein [Enemella dayhoffiae]|uniref:Phosphopeptide-binding protein n=1 Tax=Enemella dayhoffiae TaxID=2016507 RepID=A0A255GUU3_9ACTN|nr:FHA domain-containing protein [Enemella dayhoffiae]OYO19400.1 phosphopeptide-binding protein [Enemella dayhoffiae]